MKDEKKIYNQLEIKKILKKKEKNNLINYLYPINNINTVLLIEYIKNLINLGTEESEHKFYGK